MSPRKGFDADGGAFTLSCFAVPCCVCGVVCWALGPVGAGNGDWSLKWGLGVGRLRWALFP